LPNGQVLIAANAPTATTERFTSPPGHAAAATMRMPRAGHAATLLLTGQVLVTGSSSANGERGQR